MDLVTVPRVPILRTGHYELQSGPADFSAEHLHAAVAAFENDPAVLAPRIRAEGTQVHDLERVAAEAAGDVGGPALGWCDALAVDGNTLYADLHVPAELADVMEWAYPSRSIEGLFGYTTATGQRHDFLATGLLLLGTSWPGVTTLPDLHELETEFAATIAEDVAVAASAGFASQSEDVDREALERSVVVARVGATGRPPETARERLVAAGLNVSDLRTRWYSAEADGDLEGLPESYDYAWWYVTEVRADDDGTLYVVVIAEDTGVFWRFDVQSIDGTAVTFAEPVPGSLDWRPAAVAASGDNTVRPALALARWTSREDSRGVTASTTPPPATEDDPPMTDAQRQALAASLGLDPETATEAEIHAAAETRAAELTEAPEGGPEGTGTPEGAPEGEPEPAGVSARTATVSRERLAELERQAAEGATARAEQVAAQRTAIVEAAIADGRITPAEAGLQPTAEGQWPEGWRADLDAAPEVTARALERLERGKYPGATARNGVQPQPNGADRTGRVLASIQPAGANGERKVIHR